MDNSKWHYLIRFWGLEACTPWACSKQCLLRCLFSVLEIVAAGWPCWFKRRLHCGDGSCGVWQMPTMLNWAVCNVCLTGLVNKPSVALSHGKSTIVLCCLRYQRCSCWLAGIPRIFSTELRYFFSLHVCIWSVTCVCVCVYVCSVCCIRRDNVQNARAIVCQV